MADIIQLLPDSIANQIAAGEVIQRPASVVKELVENSIDAGSSQIQVIIKEAGKNLIQVIDNGKGMSFTDTRLSFERHATSKIRSADDLFRLKTMGFRGEAMASIAAVAQVEMYTCQAGNELGCQIRIEGSEVKLHEPEACMEGTSISVKNLFFNVPARRNFLKSNPVEMKHITDEFQKLALANPEIEFSLYHNDLEIYRLKPGKLSQRIVGIFGKQYREQLASVEEITDHITIRGYLGKPENAKKSRGEQFFFVNNRYIRSSYLHHAIMNAFEGLLPEDAFPFYVLFIEIDPAHIDVNVHPTKTEIKFIDERLIYSIMRSAVKQTLSTYNLAPSLDFDFNINFQNQFGDTGVKFKPVPAATVNHFQQASNSRHWEQLFPERSYGESSKTRPNEEVVTLESGLNENSSKEKPEQESAKVVFQLKGKYICSPVKSGLMLIDQQAAHERILFEKYLNSFGRRNIPSQQLLFPETLEMNPSDFELIEALREEIENLGFKFRTFGRNAIIIEGSPVDAMEQGSKELFESFIEQYKNFKSEITTGSRDLLARSLANRCAIREGQFLGKEEMCGLIDQLFACETPSYAPDGRKVFAIIEMNKIESIFNV